jgi:hypothetical protein
MAAAAAITGHLTDIRKWKHEHSEDFNADQILAPGGSR